MVTRGFLMTLASVAAMAAGAGGQSTSGADWPQWRGPDRTGLSKESALLRQWPPSGPALLWSGANLGAGYGSLAVSGDRIFVQGTRAGRSIVVTLNRAVAVSRVRGPAAALDMIAPLAPRLANYFHFFGVRGAFLMQLGRRGEAQVAFDRAIALANTSAEAAHIRMHLDRLMRDSAPRDAKATK